MCVGEQVCALVLFFVFPKHKHGWFHVRVGYDDMLVVRVLGFSFSVVHMWMWCLRLGGVCSVITEPGCGSVRWGSVRPPPRNGSRPSEGDM